MPVQHQDPELAPGYGFFLEGDGQWDIKQIPKQIINTAKFDGFLTIKGFKCAVFITPDGESWAQKVSGTPAPKGDEAAQEIQSFDLAKIAARISG